MPKFNELKITDKVPPRTVQLLKEQGVRLFAMRVVKSLLLSVVIIALIFSVEDRTRLLSYEQQPVGFISLIILAIICPAIGFKLYKLVSYRSYKGRVSDFENIRGIGARGETGKKGFLYYGNMVSVDNYTITVRTEHKMKHQFVFLREEAQFAREYYKEGDEVFYPAFAKYPVNITRYPPHPFCIKCGYIGADNERDCPECKIPMIKIKSIKYRDANY